jgi:hypothetical protein
MCYVMAELRPQRWSFCYEFGIERFPSDLLKEATDTNEKRVHGRFEIVIG